ATPPPARRAARVPRWAKDLTHCGRCLRARRPSRMDAQHFPAADPRTGDAERLESCTRTWGCPARERSHEKDPENSPEEHMNQVLPSWNDTAAKRAITDFIAATVNDGAGFV